MHGHVFMGVRVKKLEPSTVDGLIQYAQMVAVLYKQFRVEKIDWRAAANMAVYTMAAVTAANSTPQMVMFPVEKAGKPEVH